MILLMSCQVENQVSNQVDYKKIIDIQADFIGQGLKVKTANSKWNWYLPDLTSIVNKNTQQLWTESP